MIRHGAEFVLALGADVSLRNGLLRGHPLRGARSRTASCATVWPQTSGGAVAGFVTRPQLDPKSFRAKFPVASPVALLDA